MGKLADLWAEYKSLAKDNPKRKELQKEINGIESWMIERGYKTTGLTNWHNGSTISPRYPQGSGAIWWEDLNKVLEFDNK